MIGWKTLVETCSFRGEGQYPIAAYSESMLPVRLECRPCGDNGRAGLLHYDFTDVHFSLNILSGREHKFSLLTRNKVLRFFQKPLSKHE